MRHLPALVRLVAHLVRSALAPEPLDDAGEDVADALRPARRLGVVRRLLDERAEVRREQEWAHAVSRLLQGAEDAAGAVAGRLDAVDVVLG